MHFLMGKRRRPWIIVPFLLILGFSALADERMPRAFDAVAFNRFVENTRQAYAVPGAVVVIVNAEGSIFAKGYGVREQGKPGRVDIDTRFQIASLSKFVTATAVGTLVDRGLVSWDSPVRTFSPQTVLAEPYATQSATLRDFLSHRTGLPAYTGDLLTQLGLPTEELVRRARFLPFDHTFRAEMAYSNYGFFLGQEAAARAAGLSPSGLLESAILEPLAMTRSAPRQAALFEDDNRAAGHNIDGSLMAYENVDAFSGAGAIVSTGADIGKWMRMLLDDGRTGDQRILATATLRQIFAASIVEGPGGPLGDENAVAALGCDSFDFLGHRIVEKNGALNGVRTVVTLIPDQRIGIAVLANKQLTVFPEAVRAEFLQMQVGRPSIDLQAHIASEQPVWNALVAIPSPPTDSTPMTYPIATYAGAFESPLYGELRVTRQANGLTAAVAGQVASLDHWSGDTFMIRFPNPDLTPGLLKFDIDDGRAVQIEGSRVPNSFSTDYGIFERR